MIILNSKNNYSVVAIMITVILHRNTNLCYAIFTLYLPAVPIFHGEWLSSLFLFWLTTGLKRPFRVDTHLSSQHVSPIVTPMGRANGYDFGYMYMYLRDIFNGNICSKHLNIKSWAKYLFIYNIVAFALYQWLICTYIPMDLSTDTCLDKK